MPWNISSVPGSAPRTTGQPSSVLRSSLLRRRGSAARPTISPSVGRARLSGIEIEGFAPTEVEGKLFPSLAEPFALPSSGEDDFEFPSASGEGLDPEAAAAAAAAGAKRGSGSGSLDGDSFNFLLFIERGVEEQRREHADEETTGIDFHKLFPQESNTKIVAAQALLHTLTLATKSFVAVRQDKPFGPIAISVSNGSWV